MSARGPLLLAVDTSGAEAGLVLAGDGRTGFALLPTREGGYARTEDLAAEAARLFEARGCRAADLTAVGAVVGPGSYTGLRSGLAFLRGLAFADGLPAVAIGSLELLAARGAGEGEGVVAASPAGTGRWAIAAYRREAGALRELEAPCLVDARGFGDFCAGPGRTCAALVVAATDAPGAGDDQPAGPVEAARRAGLQLRIAAANREEQLASLALSKLGRGEAMRVEALVPVYVGPSSARPNRDRVVLLDASE